ncbi:MAG: hypothetical protein JWP31_2335, partial [Aeromicrobium sp.]|nr:hypothetical protein [Aeromicrobium sp.]
LVYPFVPSDGATDVIYLGVVLSCVAAMIVGINVNDPAHRLPWILMAVGQFAWFVGEATFIYRDDVLGIDPSPSVADVAYLLAYPLLAAGIGVLIPRSRRVRDSVSLIDGAVVTVSLGVLLWVVAAGPVLRDDSMPWLDRAVAIVYPVGDILLLGMLVRLMFSPGARTAAFRLICAAVVPLIVADAIYANESILPDHPVVADMLWMTSYVLWGTAALHPTMRTLTDAPLDGPPPGLVRRPMVLGASALLLPAILSVEMSLDVTLDMWAVIAGSILIVILVATRLAIDFSQIRTATEQRERLEADLFRAASHDSLTGLANRAYVLQLVQSALDRGRLVGTATGLLFVDLDGFKAVNDAIGHRGGDAVLRATAQRLRDSAGPATHVGRLAGDEFVVLVEGQISQTGVIELGAKVLEALRAPHVVDGREVVVDASIGVTISMDGGTDVSDFLQEADVASHRAKIAGRGRLEVFDTALRAELERRADIELALAAAMRNGQLTLDYQPVVALQSGVIDAYEALLRWDRPGAGQVAPDDFIPIAEMSDLIIHIDNWVLEGATRQLAQWIEDDPVECGDLVVAVNISGRHLADPRIVQDVERALRGANLPAHRLALEVTETVLVDVPTASLRLEALRTMGVSISIDDFGTGYTSIGQLQTLPADTLKIDRSFVTSLAPGSREIITLMVNAAHACGLLVIAEGVESAEDVDLLRDLACDSAQGFYIARPAPSTSVARSTPVTDSTDRPHLRPVRDS